MPKVTVLMPVYNGEKYLSEAIDSILNQCFKDFELLLINDGSTDDTARILDRYRTLDSRVKIINQKNSGIVRALNRGLAAAAGEYIARMDCDDVAHKDRLQLQVNLLDQYPSVVACGSSFRKFGSRNGLVSMPRSTEECRLAQLIGPCFAHPAVMLRVYPILLHGFKYSEFYEYAEDYKLWSELATCGELVNIEQPLIMYRIHKGQIGRTKLRRQREIHLQIAMQNFSLAEISIIPAKLRDFLWPDGSGAVDSISYAFRNLIWLINLLENERLRKWYFVKLMLKTVARNSVRVFVGAGAE